MSDKTILHSDNTFGKSPAPLIHDPNITDGAARQYAHMHWRAGQSQESFEGQPNMAKIFGLTRQTIANRINELAANDWIVVVARGFSAKTGNYRTHIYHVFELQAVCCEFRDTYQPADGETLLDKPALTQRKSRKGKGGNPKLKALHEQRKNEANHVNSGLHDHVNSGLHGGVNLSLHGGVNSGLHYPDSLDPDPSYPDSLNTLPNGNDSAHVASSPLPVVEEKTPGKRSGTNGSEDPPTLVPPPPSPTKEPTAHQQLFGAVVEVWGHDGAWAGNIACMVGGYSQLKGWKEYNFTPAGTPDGVRVFGAWYKAAGNGAALPEQPVLIQKWYYKMRLDYQQHPTKAVFAALRPPADTPQASTGHSLPPIRKIGTPT